MRSALYDVAELAGAQIDQSFGLGAHKLRDIEQGGARWTTFGDIDGNEFDLIAG